MTAKPPPLVRCTRCRLQQAFCVCAELPQIQTGPRVVVVRHFRERGKTSNTGRLVGLCIQDSVIADYGGLTNDFDPAVATAPGSWLVFPAGSTDATDAPPPPTVPVEQPSTIVLLDGTWGQARRMSHRIPGIAALPRLAVPAPRSGVRRLRQPHSPWAMSTVEATALALETLGDTGASDLLHQAFDLFFERVRQQAGRRY